MEENLASVDAVYIGTKKLRAEKVFRLEVAGLRHYLRVSNRRAYNSLTTFLDSVVKESKFLGRWRDAMLEDLGSKEAFDDYMEKVADYGTALHIAVAEFCKAGGVNWQHFKVWASDYLAGMGLVGPTKEMALAELVNDFACMVQFVHDYEVEVLGVEIPVFFEDGIGTLLDLVCVMNEKLYTEKTPKESRKRHTAIINLKSGKGGFFETHLLQLEGERRMLWQTHRMRAKAVYNLAPKTWKGNTPTYNLKNQTKATDGLKKQFDAYLKLAKLKGILAEPVREFKVFEGTTKYGDNPQNCIGVIAYNQFAYSRMDAAMAAITGIEVIASPAP